MPRDRIEFEVAATLQDALDACRTAAESEGWTAEGNGPHRVQLRKGMGGTTWPIKLDVNLAPVTDEDTSVRVDGRVGGWGPIQKRALGEALNTLQSQVLSALPRHRSRDSTAASAQTHIEALKSLGELRERGVLTDEEFAAQKAKILNKD
jgi:hypothetical protein